MSEQELLDVGPVFIPVGSVDDERNSGNNSRCLQFVDIMALGDRASAVRLRMFRHRHGWSRKDLARRASVSLQSVKLAETKPDKTPLGVFIKLSNALRVPISDLTEEILVSIDPS